MVAREGGAVLVNVGTNNVEKAGTLTIVGKYRRFLDRLCCRGYYQ